MFKKCLLHDDLADNNKMDTKLLKRGTRRRVVLSIDTNPGDIEAFLCLQSVPNGSGACLLLHSKVVQVVAVLFEHWDVQENPGVVLQTEYMVVKICTVVCTLDQLEVSFPTKFDEEVATKRHLHYGPAMELTAKFCLLAALSSLSLKCQVKNPSRETWETFTAAWMKDFLKFASVYRKDKRRLNPYHTARAAIKRRRVNRTTRTEAFTAWPLICMIEKLIEDDAFAWWIVFPDDAPESVQTAQDLVPAGIECHFGIKSAGLVINYYSQKLGFSFIGG